MGVSKPIIKHILINIVQLAKEKSTAQV
jgi:hypothetical protein